jgi:hypothetical protein
MSCCVCVSIYIYIYIKSCIYVVVCVFSINLGETKTTYNLKLTEKSFVTMQ